MIPPLHRWADILALVAGVVMTWSRPIQAASINLPNASFELPTTPYASPLVDSWQKAPKPNWYNEDGGFLWSQLIGSFRNTAPGSLDHIDNCHSNQAMWVFAVPEVGLWQDYHSLDWNDVVPSHAFDPRFEVGQAYRLTVGVIGGGGGMLEGVPIELSLYYRDDLSNRVTVAATTITNGPGLFPNTTHFVDFRVEVPPVKSTDAWAGRHLGVQILSTVTTNFQGGYWDLDNVRLDALQGPALVASVPSPDRIALTWQSDPGLRFEILATTNLAQPSSNWISLGWVTNTTGAATFIDSTTNLARRFYRARQLP